MGVLGFSFSCVSGYVDEKIVVTLRESGGGGDIERKRV